MTRWIVSEARCQHTVPSPSLTRKAIRYQACEGNEAAASLAWVRHAGADWVLEAFWACGLAGVLREKLLRMCTALEALGSEQRSEGVGVIWGGG